MRHYLRHVVFSCHYAVAMLLRVRLRYARFAAISLMLQRYGHATLASSTAVTPRH